ncbi:MAG: ABC transporter substrate-binding protein [Alphaproteobacteria bacterium]|nr:ABC transporter substrate-binding protein [Alphaproteobacteria bacterium]
MTVTRRTVLLGASAAAAYVAGAHRVPARAQAPEPAPVAGGVLRMLMSVEPPSLTSAVNSSLWIACLSTKMMEGLIAYDHEMGLKPLLAESWDFAADGLTIRFNLRRGVVWHDGKPFTAADVRFSMESVWKKLHPGGRAIFANVVASETPDDHTIIFRLSEPSSSIPAFLNSYNAQVVPQHVFGTGDILQNPALNAPIGTGPFMFKEWRKGQHVELVKNPRYWDKGKPHLDGIFARFVADAGSRAAAFEAGEVMYAPFSPVAAGDVERIRTVPNLKVETRGYHAFGVVLATEINTQSGPLKDVRVRRAIRMAIDSKFIADNVWFGLAGVPPGVLPTESPWRARDVPAWPFDTARANRLLDEAGLPRKERNMRFPLRIVFGQTGENARTAEYLRQALARIGIEIKLESGDLGTNIRRVYTERDFDLTVNTLFLTQDPAVGLRRLAWEGMTARGIPFGNASGYYNPELNRLYLEGMRTVERDKRFAIFAQMQKTLVEDVPIIYLVEPRFYTLHNTRFHGHTRQADSPYDTFADAFVTA